MARTLEAAWENKLAAVTAAQAWLAAEQARQPSTLTDEEVRWLAAAGADIRAVFDAPSTTPRERKQLIRALLTEITVHRRPAGTHRRPDHLLGRRGSPAASP